FSAIDPNGSGYVGFNVTSSPTDAVDVQQGIVVRDGNLKIGITDSQASVHINRSDVIVIPAGDTSERLDITAAIRYNSDTTSFEGYNGNNWGTLGGVKDVDGDTYVSAEDSSGIDNDELKFYTAGNESMIIDSNGVIGINTVPTGVTYKLEMDGFIGITGSILPMVDRVFNLGSTSQRWGDLFFGGETIYLGDSVLKDYSGTLTISGPAQIDSLNITHNLDIDGDVNISGTADINNLSVTNDLSISGIASTYDLYVTHDANISGALSLYDLNVSNTANITADLNISGNTNIIGAITASSINLSGSGDVNGDLSLSGDVNIGGDAQMNTISVTGDADIDGNLDVSGSLIMNNLFVTNDATIGNNLLVSGNTDLQGNLDVSGNAQIQSLNVTSDLDVDGNLDVSGSLTMNNLNVTIDASIGNDLYVTGNTILQGTLSVTDTTSLYSSLNVSGQTTINNNLDVSGNLGVSSLNVTSNAKITGNLVVDGDITIQGTTTTVNTETLTVEDPIIKLGSNNTDDVVDLGYYGKHIDLNTTTTYYSGVVRDASDGIFKFYRTQTEPTTIVDFSDPTLSYSDVKMNDLDANNIDINNANISNNLNVSNDANIHNLKVTTNVKYVLHQSQDIVVRLYNNKKYLGTRRVKNLVGEGEISVVVKNKFKNLKPNRVMVFTTKSNWKNKIYQTTGEVQINKMVDIHTDSLCISGGKLKVDIDYNLNSESDIVIHFWQGDKFKKSHRVKKISGVGSLNLDIGFRNYEKSVPGRILVFVSNGLWKDNVGSDKHEQVTECPSSTSLKLVSEEVCVLK
ncbi:hypothetical protein EB155_06480, partial [archaeon]|nr:hypothetical protein [archaeon]